MECTFTKNKSTPGSFKKTWAENLKQTFLYSQNSLCQLGHIQLNFTNKMLNLKRTIFYKCHKIKPLLLIPDSSEVWITPVRSNSSRGRVARQTETPHSFEVNTEYRGRVGHTWHHLNFNLNSCTRQEMVFLRSTWVSSRLQIQTALCNLLQLAHPNSLYPEVNQESVAFFILQITFIISHGTLSQLEREDVTETNKLMSVQVIVII